MTTGNHKGKWNGFAVDFGASSGRVVAGKFDGKTLSMHEIHRFDNEPVYASGTLFWDVLRLYHETLSGIRKGVSQVREGGGRVDSLGIDSWGVDFALLDKKGRLAGNPVHYRDHRNDGMMERTFKKISKERIFELTGIQFLPFNTIFQLAAIKEHHDPIIDNAATFLMIPDLFRYFLTGDKSAEFTDATTTQLLNPRDNMWSAELIDAIKIPRDIFPKIIPPATIVGKCLPETAESLGGLQSDVVAVATHDTASAVVAAPSSEERFAYISCGTWSCLGTEVKSPIINKAALDLNFTNEGGMNNTFRILKNIMGLWLIQESRREWARRGRNLSWNDITNMTSNGRRFCAFINPDDYHFLPPGDMPGRIREYCVKTGQHAPEGDEDLLRCVTEGLAFKYRIVLESLEKLMGYRFSGLHIMGGGSQNKLLCQYTADAIGRRVFAGPAEATAIGNLAVQLIAKREVKDIWEARKLIAASFPVAVYEPQEVNLWEDAYAKAEKINKTRV